MSYDKQNWVTGEVITAEKMNHIEEGIENVGATLIKLGSANVGGQQLGTSNAYVLQGTLAIDDGKTLREVLGGKQVVGTACKITNMEGITALTSPLCQPVISYGADDVYVTIEVDGDVEYDHLSIMLIAANPAENPSGATVEAYAICI